MTNALRIHPKDNVGIAIGGNLPKGNQELGVILNEDIPQGHKFALVPIGKGEPIIKYGSPIGHATREITEGDWIHSHNLSTSLGADLFDEYSEPALPEQITVADHKFMGYLRPNGQVGIRNELWVIPTVGCVNGQAQEIVRRLQQGYPGQVANIHAFTHNYGCSQLGTDHSNTRKALAALATHPNCGGALLIGLGCENNQMSGLLEEIETLAPDRTTKGYPRIKTLISQEVNDEVEVGIKLAKELLGEIEKDKRTLQNASKLKIGLKCGGSDGLSGITANPLVGRFSDQLIALGGTSLLTEVPEMFGAEHVLLRRATSSKVHSDMLKLLNGFREYFRSHGQPVSENPSPGNKAGGITTLEEKSLGCVQKGGTALISAVLEYAQPAQMPGLNLLWAPGNDLVASTALALSGCQMVLFTTGRGTPFGTCVPTLKISTNSQLQRKKSIWIDFNAGILAEEADCWNSTLDALWNKIMKVASGELLQHEKIGTKEIAIFKSGVTL